MADFLSIEMASDGSKPTVKRARSAINSRLKRSISTFTLASQAAGSRLMLPTVPKGARGIQHFITSSVSLGATTIAIGITGTTGKYRAAATYTAVDTPTPVAKAENLGAVELAADEVQFITTAAAALPAAGTLVVETVFTID